MAEMPVRARYAPSPTGTPHIGNLRTALFDWLLARHTGGAFVLRIEDTDQERLVPGAVDRIMQSLRWLGLDWDEGPDVGGPFGPYVESQRLPFYVEAAERLVGEGRAYRCYCTPERLAAMRLEQQARKVPTRYDRRCVQLSAAERTHHEAAGDRSVIRFHMPETGTTEFEDQIRGPISFENALQDDFIMMKSDGFPTYHLAHVVDDHMMEISHVLRGDEWISSTPKHIQLYQALAWRAPLIAHLPIILGPDKGKLSKRHGATSVFEYRDRGYLPEALVNFMALLGWSLDDHTELFSRSDLVKHFSIGRVGKNPSVFNLEKLEWMNGVYIRQMPVAELASRVLPFLEHGFSPGVPRPLDLPYLLRVLPLVQERLKRLEEGPSLTEFFFVDVPQFEGPLLVQKGMDGNRTRVALDSARNVLASLADFGEASLESVLRPLAEQLGLKTGQLFGTLRVATTGSTVAPPLFQTMAVLGKERCLRRLDLALAKLDRLL